MCRENQTCSPLVWSPSSRSRLSTSGCMAFSRFSRYLTIFLEFIIFWPRLVLANSCILRCWRRLLASWRLSTAPIVAFFVSHSLI